MRVLMVSNLDARAPFGQSARPHHLGRGMASAGAEVANLGVDASGADFGPQWSTGSQSLPSFARLTAKAVRAWRPDVIYAHQNKPAAAAIAAASGTPVVADFHSLPSVEWRQAAVVAPVRSRERALRQAAAVRAALVERLIARRAASLIAALDGLADEIERRYHPRARPAVVVNGFDPALLEGSAGSAPPFGEDRGARRHVVATVPAQTSPANRQALAFLADVSRALEGLRADVVIDVLGSTEGPPGPGLRYHGVVPELHPWLAGADACLLPYPAEASLFGGTRNKLLEALACGKRVITTREGLRGLPEAAEWPGVAVAGDTVDAFAAAVVAGSAPAAERLDPSRSRVRHLAWDVLAVRSLHELTRSAAA